MLIDLGYEDREIKTKRAIGELKVAKGRRREPYKPDYLLICKRLPRWLIEAKATDERIENFTYQCAGYALKINQKYPERPCRYYLLTNGLLTRVYVWDQEEAVLSLRFADFVEGNPKYEALRRLLGADVVRNGWEYLAKPGARHMLRRPTMDAVKRSFIRCHRIIWKSEKMSPQAAFVGFAKLLFVKLWEDRRIRDNPAYLAAIGREEALPAEAVRYSKRWIAQHESDEPNPVDNILFRQLAEQLETEIAQKRRKRIFDSGERLGMSPGTIKRVVEQLEGFYLFGIDEDLNGRMFEAFLAATMRGQALGQYFTPRSIVKLMTQLAELKAGRHHIDRVLDACCGTGGFLIDALTEMRRQIYDNTSLTTSERNKLLDEVANRAIFGIDAGREPPVARIARINMYLHGDGGSRVYMTDGLRMTPKHSGADSVEVKQEVDELRRLLVKNDLLFDVVLTNPPFSMDYAASVPDEKEVLDGYELATYGGRSRNRLRSSVMFLERYYGLLCTGGRLLTVIDDSVLAGDPYAFFRDYLRERFIIRGIVSLHGDAFQRAGARAKTSILYLTRRTNPDEIQPATFVYESRYIGLDDVVPKTPPSEAEEARQLAVDEMNDIIAAFQEYESGEKGPWLVPASQLTERLDAKHLRRWSITELEPNWKKAGAAAAQLTDLVEPIEAPVTLNPKTYYTFLRVAYNGHAESGERRRGDEVTYKRVSVAQPGDIVVSHINAVHGAICVVPEGLDGLLVSPEYTILRALPDADADPMYLWAVLRSAAVRAELLSDSSGMGRHRVDWEQLKNQQLPVYAKSEQAEIGKLYRKALEHQREIERCVEAAATRLAPLALDGETARDKLERAKPPK